MTATAFFPGFYRGAINLWVEDSLTRYYLRTVWNDDTSIMFYVGGGNEGVGAVLNEAESAGINNVYAFIDRDFRVTNRQDWGDPKKKSRRFVSSVHEIENYLLDADALSSCELNTGQRTAEEIKERLLQHADRLTWWISLRKVIADVRNDLLQDFPAHPKYPVVKDEETAKAFLAVSPWWVKAQRYLPQLDSPNLQNALADDFLIVSGWFGTEKWLSEFPGKELIRHIRDWVYTNPSIDGSSATHDSDLAKAVGEWQVANQRVPDEISDLLITLKLRSGVT